MRYLITIDTHFKFYDELKVIDYEATCSLYVLTARMAVPVNKMADSINVPQTSFFPMFEFVD